ncbi:hypothetical protein [Pontibacter liquoris]|uniref:hypothetical protein n=1 Tax=Pontibacter liquoris TaxID=2905677 RepID=UPI001FA7E83E|nr:hypothetical protein [Pontibacter liquoris]
MRYYLLLFLTMLLLLFAMPPNSRSRSADGSERVAKTCRYSHNAQKRSCPGKCLKHQTHRTPQSAANSVTDCSAPQYAVLAAQDYPARFPLPGLHLAPVTNARKHLSPDLPPAPDPPRFS